MYTVLHRLWYIMYCAHKQVKYQISDSSPTLAMGGRITAPAIALNAMKIITKKAAVDQ